MNKCKKGLLYFHFSLAFIFIHIHSFSQSTGQTASGNRKVQVIEISGSGYERGLQHGKLLKDEIMEVYKKWKENIQKYTKQNPDSVIAKFYTATNFEPAIKKWTPGLYDELKGIAKGSGQSFRDVFCFQLVDEFWVYTDNLRHTKNHHCSGMGVAATNNHPAYIAQNMDLESYMNGYQILLHITANKNEPEQYILSCSGLIALNGINSKGIAVCVNTLMELEACSDGLPVACVIRGILSEQNGEDALNFLKTIKHASGQNYIIGNGDSVYDFEASAGSVVRFLPDSANPSLVYHTNHAIVNNDVKPWYKKSHNQILSGESKNDNSVIRFTSIKNRLGSEANNSTEEIIKETLRSKDDFLNPICRAYVSGSAVFTFSSVILTLGRTPSIQLTYASPDQSEYNKHEFEEKR